MYMSKNFDSYARAEGFAKITGGFIEGPFIDDKLNREYIVFYKEERK